MDFRTVFLCDLFVVCLLANYCRGLSAEMQLISARCKNRCFSNFEAISYQACKSTACAECLKPCLKTSKKGKPCTFACGLPDVANATVCRQSCKFFKHLQLQDKNTSCPFGITQAECDLNTPQSVIVNEASNKLEANITWIPKSWPDYTVFVIAVQHVPRHKDLPTWAADKYYQTTSSSIIVELQPLLWYRFRVAAVNQYKATAFSETSRFVFAKPRTLESPWNFHVQSMHVVKGLVEVDLSWKKPNKTDLPVHKYKVAWSKRLDLPTQDFVLLKVHFERLDGTLHKYTIKELEPNTTYVFEVQAVCRLGSELRLRSKWTYLTVRTPVAEKAGKKKIEVINWSGVSKSPMMTTTAVQTTPSTFESNQSQTITFATEEDDTPAVSKKYTSFSVISKSNCFMLFTFSLITAYLT